MSTTDFLEASANDEESHGQRVVRQIEKLEAELVALRRERDDYFVHAAEMRTAANILRDVGLRAEMTDRGPFVAMDYVPKRPEPVTPADPSAES